MSKKYQLILIFSSNWYSNSQDANGRYLEVGGATSQTFEHDNKEVLEQMSVTVTEEMKKQHWSTTSVIVEVPKPPEFLGTYKGEPIFRKTSCAGDKHLFVAKDSNFNSICVHCGDTKQYLNPLSLGCTASPGDHEWCIELDGVIRCIHCGDEKP